MPTWGWVVIAVAVVVVIAALVLAASARRRRQQRLKDRFGDEYDRTVDQKGGRRQAEVDLRDRVQRRDQFEVKALSPESRARYSERWRMVQSRFVDAPGEAVDEADLLVVEVMRERGYPVDDFVTQADMVSVDHPEVVNNFRTAHRIQVQNRQQRASTDELREAVVHYRSLFNDLLLDDAGTARDDANAAG
ncbi:MAG: hypothetical protein JWL70_2878 [Acidimicrobiia bacterium]|nr:hypothetical protein [Acidimicrobiia bacterium]